MSSTVIIFEKRIFQWISCLIDTPLQEFFVSCGRSELQRTKQPKNHPRAHATRNHSYTMFPVTLLQYFTMNKQLNVSHMSNHRLRWMLLKNQHRKVTPSSTSWNIRSLHIEGVIFSFILSLQTDDGATIIR